MRWFQFRHWDLLLLQIVSEARNLHFYLLLCLVRKLASSNSLVFFGSPHIFLRHWHKKMDYFCFIDCGHLFAALYELDLTSYLPSSGVQLGYTVIFGWYAAFLFIRTGLTHSFMLSPVLLFSCYSCLNSFSGFRIEVSMFIIHTWFILVHAQSIFWIIKFALYVLWLPVMF